jgi:hypothetical protein
MRCLVAWCAAVTIAWSADARADAAWTAGAKAGVSIATLSGDDAEGAESRTTFVGGFFAQADLSRNFGLRFEALMFGKGASADSLDIQGELKFMYLELPVLLVGLAPVSDTVTLSAFAGPTIGINVGADAEIDFGTFEVSGDIGDQVADFEFGLAFGAGAAIEAGSVILVFDARYDLGLTDVDDGLSDANEDLDLANRAWAIMAGVGFPIGAD